MDTGEDSTRQYNTIQGTTGAPADTGFDVDIDRNIDSDTDNRRRLSFRQIKNIFIYMEVEIKIYAKMSDTQVQQLSNVWMYIFFTTQNSKGILLYGYLKRCKTYP